MANFCTKCGKPLSEGEVCRCSAPASRLIMPQRAMAEQAKPVDEKPVWAANNQETETKPVWAESKVEAEPVSEPKAPPEPWRMKSFDPPEERTVETPKEKYTIPSIPKVEVDTERLIDVWYKFKNHVGIGEPETNGEVRYERGKKIVPECISANEGEVPIRQYVVAKLRTFHRLHWAEGRLQVTNKRVIFRAPGLSLTGKTVLQHEFAIDEIAGIEARKEPKLGLLELCLSYWLSMLGMFFGGLVAGWFYDLLWFLGFMVSMGFMVLGVAPTFFLHKKFLLKTVTAGVAFGAMMEMGSNFFVYAMLFVILAVWIVNGVLYSIKTNLVLTIKTKGASGAVEIRRKKKTGLFGLLFNNSASEKEEYTGFSNVFPMQDTEKAIREIGAVISDIQKMGDYGIEKWKETEEVVSD